MEIGNISGSIDGFPEGSRAPLALESQVLELNEQIRNWITEDEAQDNLMGQDGQTLDNIEKEAERTIGEIFKLFHTDVVRSKRLLQNAFGNLLVVTKQLPNILHYKKEYQVSVRLLLGDNFLNYFRLQNKSKLSIQAFCCSGGSSSRPELSTIVPIATSYLENESDGLIANIKLQITPKMIRGRRKLDETASNSIDSCNILFSCAVGFSGTLNGIIEAFTATYPLKVVTAEGDSAEDEDTYENSACLWPSPMEDLIWRNAAGNASDTKRIPEKLEFGQVNRAIETKFLEFTGRNLSTKDIEIIQQKFFSPQFLQKYKADNSMKVSYADFMRRISIQETETQKLSVTYWGWFYHLAKFIQENLEFRDGERSSTEKTSFWKEGYVQGYMSSQEAAAMLKDSPNGTLLLRFSNTLPTAVTVDWRESNGVYSYRGSGSELHLRNLVDRILDTPRWKYFYPSVEKESLILRFTFDSEMPQQPSPGRSPSKTGYVTARLRSHLDLPDEDEVVDESGISSTDES